MNTEQLRTFLEQRAHYIANESNFHPLRTCIILPTRRSTGVFRSAWMKLGEDQTQWLPDLLTISDFAREKSGLFVPDKDVLLMKLFEVFQKHRGPEQDFQDFMFWGQMMLSDFDEIDKYCVDGSKLYAIIRDEKLIEAQFNIDEELKTLLKNFWNSVSEEPKFENEFLQTWELLGHLYQDFSEQLLSEGMAYEGLAYRHLLEELTAERLRLPYDTIHFIGFNAFTTIEEKLVKVLSKQYQLHLHWDNDVYFTERIAGHEAGKFLRQYKNDFQDAQQHWADNQLLSAGRKFNLHGAPLLQGQIQVAKSLMAQPYAGSTVVVLCDESMLEPLLHILPETESLNLTIGKPVGQSPLADFLDIIYNLVSGEKIYRKHLERLAEHFCFLQIAGESQARKFADRLAQSGSFWFSGDKILCDTGLPDSVSKTAQSMQEIIDVWLELLEQLKDKTDRDEHPDLQSTILAFSDNLRETLPFLQQYEHLLSIESAHLMVWQRIKSMTLPYLTENTSATQIMGFLETRLMDYDRVIILGANEDLLPASRRGNSYIPYNLRRVFGLPTLQEFDGVYAYHFFRLLQRSTETHLIYNDTPGDNVSFEKSRFLEQIQLELDSPENLISRQQWTYPMSELRTATQLLEIEKTAEHVQMLEGFRFSQSALSTYLLCPVQFYLNYVARLQEPDTLEEIMDAGTFGTVLHDTIEGMYTQLTDRLLGRDDFLSTKNQVDEHLKVAFGKSGISYDELKGENLLAHDVIRAAILKLVDADALLAEQEPFIIKGLEIKKAVSIEVVKGKETITIQLSGKIDRLDAIPQADGTEIYRILDYKTGKLEVKEHVGLELSHVEGLCARHQVKPKKQIFQGLFYQILLGDQAAKVGFYGMRALNEGILYINEGRVIDPAIRLEFEQHIAALLQEIIDPGINFIQNPNPDAYQYSPYGFLVG
jgi:hypothetical protein